MAGDPELHFESLESAIQMLSTLPGIGRRSAMRIAFHILNSEENQARQLAESILRLKREVRFCAVCGGLSASEVCGICSDDRRSSTEICVVEEPSDIYSIEETGEFTGKYHVLQGALSPLDGIGPEELRIKELLERVSENRPAEVIVATNPTMEGDATAHYLADLLRDRGLQVSRLSHGISTGGTIEYSDRSALARSIRHRQNI